MEQGRQHLQSYLGELLDTISKSAPTCPPVIRATFRQLFQRVGERFPEHQVRLGVGTLVKACGGAGGAVEAGVTPRHEGGSLFGRVKKGHCQKAGCAGAVPVCLVASAPAYGAGPVGRSPGSRAPQAAPQHQGAEPGQGEVPPAPILARSHINTGLALVPVASPCIPSASIAVVPGGVPRQDGPSHILVAAARQVRGRHQLPLPPLLLAGHHDPQALPPAGRARRCAHQPHAAAPGQGGTGDGRGWMAAMSRWW